MACCGVMCVQEGKTALILAGIKGHKAVVKLLLEGAGRNATCKVRDMFQCFKVLLVFTTTLLHVRCC